MFIPLSITLLKLCSFGIYYVNSKYISNEKMNEMKIQSDFQAPSELLAFSMLLNASRGKGPPFADKDNWMLLKGPKNSSGPEVESILSHKVLPMSNKNSLLKCFK